MMRNNNRRMKWLGVPSLCLMSAVACEYEFSTERIVPTRGTLGEEVYKIVVDEAAHSSRDQAARVDRVTSHRDEFVRAIDNVLPPARQTKVQAMLVGMLPLYDEGFMSRTTQAVAGLLADMARDANYLNATVRAESKANYLRTGSSLIQHIVSFPELRAQLSDFTKLALANDGRDESGRPSGESPILANLLAMVSRHLTAYAASNDPARFEWLFADLLLKEDDRVARAGLGAQWAARPDQRGIARVRVNAATGALFAPFVDRNPADGFADINAVGDFVDANGQTIALEPFGASTLEGITRATDGRAIAANGQPIFDYVDLNKTLAGALFDDTLMLIDREILFKLMKTVPLVMGPRIASRGAEGRAFQAFGTADSPLLDLVHALVQVVDMPDLSKLLRGAKQLLDQKSDVIAGAVREFTRLHAIAAAHTEALGEPRNTFLDDLKPVILEIVETDGMLQSLLEALINPVSRDSDRGMVLTLRHKKERTTISETNRGASAVFTTPIDRTRPDTNGNRSLFLRLMHLIHDTNGVRFVPATSSSIPLLGGLPLGALLTIDDLGVFYFDVVAGNARVSSLVATATTLLGTPLSTTPTPEQVNRFINTPNTLMTEPIGKEGVLVRENYGDALLVMEAAGLQKSLKPIVKVFSDRGKSKLLVKFFETIYMHWASPQSNYQSSDPSRPMYAKRSGLDRYEPVMIELWSSPFMDRMRALATEVSRIEIDGVKFSTYLERAARKLFKPAAALRTRAGLAELTHPNGVRVAPLTTFDLIRSACNRIDLAFSSNAAARDTWRSIRDTVQDLYFEVDESSGSPKLKNQTGVVFASHLIGLLIDRVRVRESARDLSTRLASVYRDVEDFLGGFDFAVLFDALTLIDGRAETKRLTQSLLKHILFKTGNGRDALLRSTSRLFFTMLDGDAVQPIFRFMGNVIKPENDFLWKMLDFHNRVDGLDTEGTMIDLLRSGFDPSVDGKTPFDIIGELIRDVQRANPAETGRMSANDHRQVLSEAHDYLLDTRHGVEKLIDLVKSRK